MFLFFLRGGGLIYNRAIAGENRLIEPFKFAKVLKAGRTTGSVASSYSVHRTDLCK